jgi:hypothetical protein
MRPGGRVIHDIPAAYVFFFCSSSGMQLGQAVLAFWREKITFLLTKLCRNGKNRSTFAECALAGPHRRPHVKPVGIDTNSN